MCETDSLDRHYFQSNVSARHCYLKFFLTVLFTCHFLTQVCWPIFFWILDVIPLQIPRVISLYCSPFSRTFYCALYSPCFPRLSGLCPYHRESAELILGFPSMCLGLEILSKRKLGKCYISIFHCVGIHPLLPDAQCLKKCFWYIWCGVLHCFGRVNCFLLLHHERKSRCLSSSFFLFFFYKEEQNFLYWKSLHWRR